MSLNREMEKAFSWHVSQLWPGWGREQGFHTREPAHVECMLACQSNMTAVSRLTEKDEKTREGRENRVSALFWVHWIHSILLTGVHTTSSNVPIINILSFLHFCFTCTDIWVTLKYFLYFADMLHEIRLLWNWHVFSECSHLKDSQARPTWLQNCGLIFCPWVYNYFNMTILLSYSTDSLARLLLSNDFLHLSITIFYKL